MSGTVWLWILGGIIGVFVGMAIYAWVRAEIDERRWRRLHEERLTAAMIREKRYGAGKGVKL